MFLDELSPPVSFMGGFFSGVLRLNLQDEPVKTWLTKQKSCAAHGTSKADAHNGKGSAPQQISIE